MATSKKHKHGKTPDPEADVAWLEIRFKRPPSPPHRALWFSSWLLPLYLVLGPDGSGSAVIQWLEQLARALG